jgi:hypothetical protein
MMFSFIGSASLYVATVALAPPPNVVMAAFANGLTLGIVSASLALSPNIRQPRSMFEPECKHASTVTTFCQCFSS